MTKKLIISCEDTTSQSPYTYEQRAKSKCPGEEEFCCPYDTAHFSSALASSDNEPFINEHGEYISVSS